MNVIVNLFLICNFVYYISCHHIQKRIVNGQEAKEHSLPYQVHLVMILKNGDVQICGGALISKNYVMTAAHCFLNRTIIMQTLVVLGAHDLREGNYIYQVVKDYIIHKDFKHFPTKGYTKNDIALIKLPETVNYSETIKAVNLPRRSQVKKTFKNVKAVEAGWGRTENNSISMILRQGIVKVSEDEDICTYPKPLICSISMDNHASCVGDSGSPLVFNNTAIGIISSGFCSIFSYYTRVTSFLDWIQKHSDVKILD